MSFKPSDFFIGVIEFFAVLLPGALLVYFFMGQQLDAQVFGAGKLLPAPSTDGERWLIFFIAVYITGNIIMLLSSMIIDSLVYDKFLRDRFFKKNFDLSYKTATFIRDQYIPGEAWISRLKAAGRINENEIEEITGKRSFAIVNTCKWGQHFLAITNSEGVAEIRRIEADSKFFRSLVVVFFIIGVVMLFQQQWLTSACCLLLCLLCLYRYGHLRYKCTDRTCELIITANHREKEQLGATQQLAADNRYKYVAESGNNAKWDISAKSLLKGIRKSGPMMVIPPTETWKATNNAVAETLICLSGKTVVTMNRNNLMEKIAISPNAILTIDKDSSFEMTNSQTEPLVLLALK